MCKWLVTIVMLLCVVGVAGADIISLPDYEVTPDFLVGEWDGHDYAAWTGSVTSGVVYVVTYQTVTNTSGLDTFRWQGIELEGTGNDNQTFGKRFDSDQWGWDIGDDRYGDFQQIQLDEAGSETVLYVIKADLDTADLVCWFNPDLSLSEQEQTCPSITRPNDFITTLDTINYRTGQNTNTYTWSDSKLYTDGDSPFGNVEEPASSNVTMINWDFENGNEHHFTFWSVYPTSPAADDETIAGDESLTGIGESGCLPAYGVAWTVGSPNQFDGQIPAISEGDHINAAGVLDYTLDSQPISSGTDFDCVNERGQSGYLNTYNLNQCGENLHLQINDQIASSPVITLGENAVMTVWSQGGGVGTHAPEYDAADKSGVLMYSDGSSGIAVISAEGDDMYAILASLHLQGQGTLTENTLDLSAFAGRRVIIDVVDAFEGTWGWLAIDEIQITNSISKNACLIVQLVDGEPTMGLDQAQIDRLAKLGYSVKIVPQEDVQSGAFSKADCDSFDLLVVSESISSSAADNLIGTTTPMMHQEAYGWDNWFFMGTLDLIGWQTTMDIDIVNDTHPIMVDANIPLGPLTFFVEPGNDFTSDLVSILAPGAELLAKITTADGNDMAFAFAIEKGAELANGSMSPNRVVGFSLPGFGTRNAEIMTDEAWVFYDAAIRWLDTPEAQDESPLLINGSFELPGTDKMDGFNGDKPSYGSYGEYEGNPIPAGPDTDVPGWITDGETQDCGIQTDDTTDGEWLCFLRGGGLIDQGLWQLTEHVIGADDVIAMSMDAKHNWANEAYTITISVYYDDNGSRVTIASEDIVMEENLGEQGDWQTYTLTSDVSAVPEAVGKKLGVEIRMTGNYTFALIDNVVLEVN